MRSLNVANNLMKILLYFSLQNIIISYIKLPIYTYHSNPPNKTTEFDYIKYFLENNIYTYLNLGSPPQKIVATLNFNDYPFFIYYNKCEIFSYFDIEKSNSYQKRPHQYLLTDVYVYTHIVKDFFYFNKNENDYYNLNYLFSPMNNGTSEQKLPKLPYTCAQIGLKLSYPDLKSYNYNFIRELKLNKAIKDYVFFVEYDEKNNDEGYLIIGDEPYEYNNEKYKYSQLKEISAIQIKRDLYWNLKFNSIYFNKKENETNFRTINLKELNTGLDHNLNVILATYEFMLFIEEEFFKEKIKNQLCKRNRLQNNFYNYDCLYLKDIQEFPTLYFNNRNLGFTFELSYKDIFIEYNGRYMCLVWIDMNDRQNWRLGKPFLKKYFFSFNVDRKIMGFYKPYIKNVHNKLSNMSINIIYIIIILFLLAIITWMCYLFAKKIYLGKRKVFNENISSELIYMKN